MGRKGLHFKKRDCRGPVGLNQPWLVSVGGAFGTVIEQNRQLLDQPGQLFWILFLLNSIVKAFDAFVIPKIQGNSSTKSLLCVGASNDWNVGQPLDTDDQAENQEHLTRYG